ncbi:MAG: transglutaminase family protein [Cytophagaceae bacterium]|nr:transglutaminase family protein [Cytophagaceae bacterium]
MKLFVRHQLVYTYSKSVSLTPHTLHLYPPTNPFVRLDRHEFQISPEPEKLVLTTDVEGNVQHQLFYQQPTNCLDITAEMEVTTLLENPFDFIFHPVESYRIPFQYSESIKQVLQAYLQPRGATTLVEQFARQVAAEANWKTLPFLTHLNKNIRHNFDYEVRETGPPLSPEQLLLNRKGSCRDYVSLYMAACQVLGLAARFVSGYYFGELKDEQYLHAWAEVYLPGAGWRGFDPTQNAMVADRHVPLAASLIPKLVTPVAGSFAHKGGVQSDFQATVSVRPLMSEIV